MCTNLLQISKAQFERLKRVQTSLIQTSGLSSFAAKGMPSLVVWFFYYDVN
jgi:hypothetical protein